MMTWMKDHHECVVDGAFIRPEQVLALADGLRALQAAGEKPLVLQVQRWEGRAPGLLRPGLVTVSAASLLKAADRLKKLEGTPTDDS